jgi:ribonuclease P protein component
MTRSADFTHTVKHGVRASQPDIVVHARRLPAGADAAFPEIGFVVSKSVGNAVDRHRVARRLRHAARIVVADLDPADRIVVRALPSSRDALSTTLRDQLVAGVRRVHHLMERHR